MLIRLTELVVKNSALRYFGDVQLADCIECFRTNYIYAVFTFKGDCVTRWPSFMDKAQKEMDTTSR